MQEMLLEVLLYHNTQGPSSMPEGNVGTLYENRKFNNASFGKETSPEKKQKA